MNSLTKSLTKDLKLLLKKFPNKASINLSEAKEYMSKTLNIYIDLLDDNLIHTYLKQKGYKEIVKNKKKAERQKIDSQKTSTQKNTFDIDSIDLDMDLDHLLDFDFNSDSDLFDSVDIEKIDINNKHHTYDNNKELLSEYVKTKNPILVEDLMSNNRFLVIKFAKLYKKIIGINTSLDEDDLIQAGMIGLHKAINKYDIDKGSQFSTYAVFWIKQSITREIMDNGNVVRIPVHLGQDLLKLKKLESDSILTFGHIDIKYICKKMNISESKYNSLKEVDYRFSKMRSIDIYVNEESSETSIIDFLDSKNSLVDLSDDFLDPMELALKNVISQNLLNCLNKLTEKEKDVLLLRFGFIDGTPHTLEYIGSKYNVTRERIRQIEAKALKKLRMSKSVRQLIKDDNTQENKKKSYIEINTLSKKTNNVKNYNTKLTSNKSNTTSKKVTHSVISNKLNDVKNINNTTNSISILKSTKSINSCVSLNNNSKTSNNINSSTSKTNINSNKNIISISNSISDLKIPTKVSTPSNCSNYSKRIKNVTNDSSKMSNKKTTNSSKKLDTMKNTKNNIVNNMDIDKTNLSSGKKVSKKYNVNSFKKEVSKGFFNKLKSKYNGEYLLAEEYSQIALSVKVYHTKCGSEFYTRSSTLLNKRPPCPVCEYKEYIASKIK